MYPQQPQYPAQPQPQYPQAPQQFAQPAPYPQTPTIPQQPLAAGTLDSFFGQPSTGGGKSLNFSQVGTSYIGVVTRPITNGDIQQQTDIHGTPQVFKDGRPKFVMKVPLALSPSPEYPDGLGVWYVKGQARDELVRAMAEAGAPDGPPEAGAVIQITHTGTRPSGPGMNPTKLFQVVYRCPDSNGQAPAASVAPVSATPAAAQPVPQPAVPVQEPASIAQGSGQPTSAPEGMSPEHAALLTKLLNQQQIASQ